VIDLRQAARDYIAVRRALGSRLQRHPRLLENFVDYLEAAGATTVTTELALSWATLPGDGAHPTYLSNRLCVVRASPLLPRPKCRAAPGLQHRATHVRPHRRPRQGRPAAAAAPGPPA
jgi:integrase/recombinase XerD